MTILTVGGAALNYCVEGDVQKPALLLSHPLGANLRVWDGLMPDLLGRFRVIRADTRGHGASGAPPGPTSLDRLGGDALALLDAAGVEKAHFLGLSMGGAIGQWLMLYAPQRLSRVVLANTAAQMPRFESWNQRIRLVRREGMAALAPAILQRWLTASFQARQPEATQAIEKMLLASDPTGYAACCAALRDMDLREKISAAEPRPVLVIVGAHDASTPPEKGAALAASLPGAKLVRLPTAHLSCVEDAKGFLGAVLPFLNEH
jgi:3-oxoadipate enol-lactonase